MIVLSRLKDQVDVLSRISENQVREGRQLCASLDLVFTHLHTCTVSSYMGDADWVLSSSYVQCIHARLIVNRMQPHRGSK